MHILITGSFSVRVYRSELLPALCPVLERVCDQKQLGALGAFLFAGSGRRPPLHSPTPLLTRSPRRARSSTSAGLAARSAARSAEALGLMGGSGAAAEAAAW